MFLKDRESPSEIGRVMASLLFHLNVSLFDF